MGRADLLDKNGASEIVPIYPSNFKILRGKDKLKCTQLVAGGMSRFSTTCCNTPVANTDMKRPWVGVLWRALNPGGPQNFESAFGEIRSSIMGKFARGERPAGVPEKFDFKGFRIVMPFLLKGMIMGRAKPSPFFENGKPIGQTKLLTPEERAQALTAAGHGPSKA